jgi:SAM-dependent methyltransferase
MNPTSGYENVPNLDRFSGFADLYDRYRPTPPPELSPLLGMQAGLNGQLPALVVDLGSGTGLSTRYWLGLAKRVIGIEPNDDMRRQAITLSEGQEGIEYLKGLSSATGLPDGCADIVTACQALHWMEPEPTFAEIARILRPGGVFAAVDNDWPPVVGWEAEQASYDYRRVERAVHEQHPGYDGHIRSWAKPGHLDRMEKSGRFGFVREMMLHKIEPGNAERMIGLELSQGSTQSLLRNGLTEEQIGFTPFRRKWEALLGSEMRPFYFTYRIRLGVKIVIEGVRT